MLRFETEIRIQRPVREVFAYLSSGEHGPEWNSVIVRITPLSDGPVREGSRYRMVQDLPGGRVENVLEVIEHVKDQAFAVRTVSGPTPFTYRYRFTGKNGVTLLILQAEIDEEKLSGFLGMAGQVMPDWALSRLIEYMVKRNMESLKKVLESPG